MELFQKFSILTENPINVDVTCNLFKLAVKKLAAMIWQVFLCFLLMSNKNSRAHIKKLVKTLMEFFRKFAILTENPISFDVTCSVILGTVRREGGGQIMPTTFPKPRIFKPSYGPVQ